MSSPRKNIIIEKTFFFSLEVINFCEVLEENRKFVIARQLLRSGTSIGANVREAQNPNSRADFIHKLKIAIKEAEETEYWIELINESSSYPTNINILNQVREIKLILAKIITSSKSNQVSEPELTYEGLN